MLGSRYIQAVRDDVEIWDGKLNLVSEILDEWLNCQRNWMYLETIFSAPDIQKQMPAESKVCRCYLLPTLSYYFRFTYSLSALPSLRRACPSVQRFFEVDRHFKDVMRKTNRNPNVINACELPGLLAQFVSDNKELDQVQKQLEEYLETKRAAFPRFYFLSNDEYVG
jgi:dynein heavy chain